MQERADLPTRFVEWADGKMGAPLQYITWFGLGEEVFLDYGEAGSLKLVMRNGTHLADLLADVPGAPDDE